MIYKKPNILFYIAMCTIFILLVRWPVKSFLSNVPVCVFCNSSHVIHNYYKATGISSNATTPESVESIYGKPVNIQEETIGVNEKRVYYHYDGFAILFLTEDLKSYKYAGFALYSPEIKIRRDIHVGSTREQIIHAYHECNSYFYKSDYDKLGDAYYDTGIPNNWSNLIKFHYNENDVVTEIIYIP